MKESLTKVRKALSRSDITARLTQYLVKDGTITAGDGRYVACAPIDCDQNFLVPGREFERLIDRLPSVEEIIIDERSITLKSKRMRGTIDTLPIIEQQYPAPGQVWNEVPPRLLDALATVRPFISDNALHQYALCACIGRDSIIATNNVSLVQVDCPMVDGSGHLLPIWAIDYLLARKDADLDGFQLYPGYAAFRFDDGSWMRTQLINEEFPMVAGQLFERYEKPTWELTDEWRSAFKLVEELTENMVEIHTNKLVGRQGVGVVEHEIPDTPVPSDGYSVYNSKFLEAIVRVATHWQPDVWPNPSPFAAQGVRGFVIGRRL